MHHLPLRSNDDEAIFAWFSRVLTIRRHQIFLGGPRKIFGAPPARKKRGSQIFRLRRAFFVVEALKIAKKLLNR